MLTMPHIKRKQKSPRLCETNSTAFKGFGENSYLPAPVSSSKSSTGKNNGEKIQDGVAVCQRRVSFLLIVEEW